MGGLTASPNEPTIRNQRTKGKTNMKLNHETHGPHGHMALRADTKATEHRLAAETKTTRAFRVPKGFRALSCSAEGLAPILCAATRLSVCSVVVSNCRVQPATRTSSTGNPKKFQLRNRRAYSRARRRRTSTSEQPTARARRTKAARIATRRRAASDASNRSSATSAAIRRRSPCA